MINHPRENVDFFINSYTKYQKKLGVKSYSQLKKDTVSFLSYHQDMPFELLYLFKKDTCIYQEINIYCSPCAEQSIEAILKDKNYKFKAIDGTNYLSQKDKTTILRISQNNKDTITCHKITARKIR